MAMLVITRWYPLNHLKPIFRAWTHHLPTGPPMDILMIFPLCSQCIPINLPMNFDDILILKSGKICHEIPLFSRYLHDFLMFFPIFPWLSHDFPTFLNLPTFRHVEGLATRDGLGDLLRRRQALLRTAQRFQGVAGVATSYEDVPWCALGDLGTYIDDMILYDMIWFYMIWYDMIMIWYDMIWYDNDMIWYDMTWYDMIWYDMIWYNIIYIYIL